ncbi:MAG TPA: adenylate/guanylate cyclase domain-containing protein, partial [Burkholderiales bacterium]|nr:adenylate/guanylate cyclase domain-containing protein [Burkholderiales bacterium]
FARYVPPGVVARLDRDPSKLELGGERREVTMIFTDIAGFTTTAEKLDPHVLVEFMNNYLDGLGNAVLEHGGTIDKFLGDGSMSFFGAPESFEDDADRAVECALAIDAYAKQIAKDWGARGLEVGVTRIGVHTGHAIVGNFGGQQRFDYTALGDTVNTASRLEGANKMFGTRVIISGDTLAKLKRGHARPVGDVVVKGREQALPLYEAVTEADWNSSWMKRYLECFEVLKNGGDALKGFEAYVAHNPNDSLGKYHLARLKNGERGIRIVLVEK